MTARPADQRYRGKVGAQLKQDDALALFVAGDSYPEIARKLGYAHRSGAYNAVTAALARHDVEAADLAEKGRAIALARLRPLWKRSLANALAEDGGAKDIMAAAQIADRLQRLEGIKDPTQEIRLTVETELDRDIRTLLDALNKAGVDPSKVLGDAAR